MLIESIIRRVRGNVQGSRINVGGRTYRFVPKDPSDPDSPHVCEVEDKAVIQRLLSISEGYRIYDEVTSHQPPVEPVPPPLDADEDDTPINEPATTARYDGPPIDLPDFTAMKGKKEVVAWAAQHLPDLPLNPKLPEGRIVQVIREYVGA